MSQAFALPDAVHQHGAQQQQVAREREHVRKVERDPTRRSLEDERIGNALLPHEQRDQVAERTARSNSGTENCSA